MRKAVKWLVFALVGLAGVVVVGAVVIFVITSIRLGRTYDVEPAAIAVPDDEAALERGEHLARAISGCDGCHGDNLGGMVLLDDPAIMALYGPNLTVGEGGAGARLSDEDWVRAIRHGLDPDGKPLLLMPAQNYRRMTDEDLGALLAYIKSLGPVDNEVPEPRIGPLGYLLALTEPGFLPAALFDHAESPATTVEPGVTVKYGGYLVALGTCRDCHGEHLNGRPLPPMLDEPPARNLTPAGQLANWSEEDFIQTIRTGVTPGGHTLREPMAGVLTHLQRQTDDELRAIFMYLQSLPPREFGE
ncbi:MAG: cytochrome c [Candidatus Promineifilaceae bacterium]|nr:cytochrome c [Candidatus Promineifilaceae bacterium]